MIIWSGRGILVLLIVFCCSAIAQALSNSLAGGDHWDKHGWPLGLAFWTAGAICWFLGQSYHKQPGRVLIDPKTGGEVMLRANHSLFWIPVRWWGPILGVIGLLIMLLR